MEDKGPNELVHIQDGEILYKYVNPLAIPEGQKEIPPTIFSQKEMSCDWAKYQKEPKKSFHIAEGKTIIVSITVCEEIRNPRNPKNKGSIEPAWAQLIIHDPVSAEDDPTHGANFSHSLIKGKKKGAVQETIAQNSTWKSIK